MECKIAAKWGVALGSVVCSGVSVSIGQAQDVEIGPDLIVGNIPTVVSYGTENGISAFAAGATICNQGDEEAVWVASTNEHPVIAQNMYRLMDGRFEQIGMAWIVHEFFALQFDACQLGCQPAPRGTRLGVRCSTVGSASINGVQQLLGPRSQVNAYTGEFIFPPDRPSCDLCGLIDRRLQVHDIDLDPELNDGALYFVEVQPVSPDDALAGNGENNASYRRIIIAGPVSTGPLYRASTTGPTQQTHAAVRAWQDNDSTVFETDVRVPGEGLFILAGKAGALGDGFWQYKYAIQNINSDRSCGSFSVPLLADFLVGEIGFHDVAYHSGEPYDGTDWTGLRSDGAITWSTTSYDVDADANALRWGTLYNFRFVADAEPGETTVTLRLFKPGSPVEVTATMIGPIGPAGDCNGNEIPDACDIDCNALGCAPPSCGTSTDCDDTGIPDECEPQEDCNANGVIDACDLAGGRSSDCNTNGVPDDCEPDCDGDGIPDDCDTVEDCDEDGIEDCLDLCPCSTPRGACVCPAGLCCFDPGFCLPGYPHADCLTRGGTPDCMESCRAGCTLDEVDGDFDHDGDQDMQDYGRLLVCFTGAAGQPGVPAASTQCLVRFDFDGDNDVDLTDFREFGMILSGPYKNRSP